MTAMAGGTMSQHGAWSIPPPPPRWALDSCFRASKRSATRHVTIILNMGRCLSFEKGRAARTQAISNIPEGGVTYLLAYGPGFLMGDWVSATILGVHPPAVCLARSPSRLAKRRLPKGPL